MIDRLEEEALVGLVERNGRPARASLEKCLPTGEVEVAADLFAAMAVDTVGFEYRQYLRIEEPRLLGGRSPFLTEGSLEPHEDESEECDDRQRGSHGKVSQRSHKLPACVLSKAHKLAACGYGTVGINLGDWHRGRRSRP